MSSNAKAVAVAWLKNPYAVLAVVGVAGAAFVWWKWGDSLKKVVTETLNPLSDKNAAYQGASAAVDAVAQLFGADPDPEGTIGTKLFNWTHPDSVDENLFYTIKFPDGSKHAIGSTSVAGDGTFSYQDVRYKLFVDPAGNKVAQRV